MKSPILPVLLLLAFFLSACQNKGIVADKAPSGPKAGEKTLVELMTGSFDSKEQAEADTAYYDITLHMFPIWTYKSADYLYVEQAVSSMPRKPYRQRVYKVEEISKGAYKSTVYTIKDDSLFIGRWKRPSFFDDFDTDILEEREGCTVYMNWSDTEYYSGATRGQDCMSTLRGASYATSIVEVRNGIITSWDQGFDTDGKQAWGAVDGPYEFKRRQAMRPKLSPQRAVK